MEAQFHALQEYMTYVDEWFDIYEKRNPGVQRRVYLASDDPNVLQEAKNKYVIFQKYWHNSNVDHFSNSAKCVFKTWNNFNVS